MSIAIIVHGGAGAWNLKTEGIEEASKVCVQATAEGQAILLREGAAL